MSLRSKLFLLLLSLAPALMAAEGDRPDLFSVVPLSDVTYSRLDQLAKAGFLNSKDLAPVLTRYDVVQLIGKAEASARILVVAQADEIPPPPPSDGGAVAPSSPAPSAPAPASPAAAPAGDSNMELPAPGDVIGTESAAQVNAPAAVQSSAAEEANRTEAIKSLRSLEEAYQYELKLVKDKVKALSDAVDQVDADQYDLRKRLKGISQFPTIAVHGLGRAIGIFSEYDMPGTYAGYRHSFAYLDIRPEGTVSKEVKWNAILRLGTPLNPNDSPSLLMRRVTMDFDPPWFSAKVGDFDEAYTPLTLWNRNSLDLRYMPEMVARWDDQTKYESFLNNAPYWPLRGLRVGSDAIWPDSGVLREIKGSVFAHMIRNGFNDNGGWYLGPDPVTGANRFTDWVFGANASVKSQKWYWAGLSIQSAVDAYGLVYDEPWDTSQPTPYAQFTPNTWAHQYLIGSVRPDLKVGLGGDFYVGGMFEYAQSHYQDDKLNSARVFNDFAMLGGPYFQFGDSKITFNYLNVGPYYYSPLAQTRQDDLASASTITAGSPNLFDAPLRNQYFLTSLPRASAIYGFYDRTQDNSFPYGLGTPNRQGFGGELDVKTLEKDALRIKGSVYFVQEIGGNLVVNGSGTGFLPVDSPTNSTLNPIRNFTYVNVGPSFNLGPSMGLDRDVEIGTNVRYEQTSSVLGTLTSTWILGGLRADILPVWEVSVSYGIQKATGTEAGYGGVLISRYPYLYDNSDLGAYTPVTIDRSTQSARFSMGFKVNRNSTIYLDYDWTDGNLLLGNPSQPTLSNHFGEVTYEIQF